MSASPAVELVYDRDCPNVERAREQLRLALGRAGLPARWKEWDRDAIETPSELRAFGSPTVLVNGRDVASRDTESDHRPDANSCRVYVDQGTLRGVPPLALIVSALMETGRG